MRKTAYLKEFEVKKEHNSCKKWRRLMAFELDLTCIKIKWYTKCQINMSKHVGEKCGKLWRTDGRTETRKIRVRFPAYLHRVWALWWQGGKRRLRTSRCPCRGRLGTLKTPSCPWRGCPTAGQNLETGHLSRQYIAEISLNVTLNHKQQHRISLSGLNKTHSEIWKFSHLSIYAIFT